MDGSTSSRGERLAVPQRAVDSMRDTRQDRLCFLCITLTDLVGLVFLLLDLPPPGMPQSYAELFARLRDPGLPRELWFMPVAVLGCVVVLCGAVSPIVKFSIGLWMYSFLSVLLTGWRLFLLYEQSCHDGYTASGPLLVAVLLNSAFILNSLAAASGSATLAIRISSIKCRESKCRADHRRRAAENGSITSMATSRTRGVIVPPEHASVCCGTPLGVVSISTTADAEQVHIQEHPTRTSVARTCSHATVDGGIRDG
jgi:hypothetical protein